MEKLKTRPEIQQEEFSEYLRSGEQTAITERIAKIAEGFNGNIEDKIGQIFNFLETLDYRQDNKEDVFRKRTADQILEDGYVTGCTDEALAFIVLARAVGIPSKYIEAIDKSWLESKGEGTIDGHVYAGVFDDGRWRIVDPSRKKLDADIDADGRIVFAEGLDSWDIGIRDFESLRLRFEAIKEGK